MKIFLFIILSFPLHFSGLLAQNKTNIILFLSDDHGWHDSGIYGDKDVKTPNIDRLATEGMLFEHAYAGSPLCSPSRSVIATGLMPHRNGAHKFGTPINKDIKTMPEYFKELGYFTAHFGKFHHMPRNRFPYDHVVGDENKAVAFLNNYKDSLPLLLVVCTHPPHTPWVKNESYDPTAFTLPPNFIDTEETRQDRAKYYSDVTLMDNILGQVIDAIKTKRIYENTFFIYTSDQGANWPFGKWCLYDNGLRVPLISSWPNRIDPNSKSDAFISLSDILPTLIDVAGGKPPTNIDGKSILPVLLGEKENHREVIFGSHTGNDNGGSGIWNHCPARTIRTKTHRYILNLSPDTTFTTHITGTKSGDHYLPFWNSWIELSKTDNQAKKIVDAYLHRPSEELYDLEKDPYEMNNLAEVPEYTHLLNPLREQLATWCKTQNDTIPLIIIEQKLRMAPAPS
jgi:N-sulfoglucosamine sulfohydrolase